ncbi:hypothetical protein GUJ93_ZPchr0007g4612 [Zizania palustris]|uniref:Uncharacterized protein n=1 Tax=Zizania palustris TaxID=103762 RepID=A0A8J5TJK6_ZIZPA|nr:hypothetical protein GUJ93_ZPchr0007g4612 [Zizania palustris]
MQRPPGPLLSPDDEKLSQAKRFLLTTLMHLSDSTSAGEIMSSSMSAVFLLGSFLVLAGVLKSRRACTGQRKAEQTQILCLFLEGAANADVNAGTVTSIVPYAVQCRLVLGSDLVF